MTDHLRACSRRELLLGASLSLVGCGSKNSDYFGDTTPPEHKRLVFESGSEPESLDPARCLLDVETYVQVHLFEGLVMLHPTTTEPFAALPTHYERNDSCTRFTFYLRGHEKPRGIRLPNTGDLPDEYSRGHPAVPDRVPAQWSDGRPISAHDFVYAWQRVLNPATAAYLAPVYFAGIRAVRAVDEFTFQVDLSDPNPIFVNYLWLPPFAAVPCHAIETAAREGREASWTEPGKMLSSGPFVLDEWLPKNRIVLRKNQRYYERDAVFLEELTFLPTVSEATRMNLYKTGQSHVTPPWLIPPILAPVVTRARDSVNSPGCRTVWYSVNTTRPPLDNVWLRYALNMAIDKVAITKNFGAGRIPARGFVPPIPGYKPPASVSVSLEGRDYDILSFDPAAARSILGKAGYPGGTGSNGRQLAITITFPESETKLLQEIVQQQWRSLLNLEAALRVEETSTFWGETCLRRSYDGIVRDSWVANVDDPFDFLLQFGPAQFACSAWADKTYDSMVAEAQSTLNPVERLRKLADVETYLLRQMPLLPIYHDSWLSLRKPYVRGVPQNRLGWPQLKYAWIDHNWRPS